MPRALKGIQDESYRDEVALLLIRSESPNFWANEGMRGSVIWHYMMIEPFEPTFERHMPSAGPLLEILATRELRLKTAAELATAMHGTTATSVPETPGGETRRYGIGGPAKAADPAAHRIPSEKSAPPASSSPSLWWIGFPVLLGAAFVLLRVVRKLQLSRGS